MFKAIEAARKQAHRGTIMSDITNEVLTAEEIRELREIRERFRNQDLRDEQSELPEDIQLELEASSKIQLKNKLKQYTRETIKLEGGKWTQTGTINKVYLPGGDCPNGIRNRQRSCSITKSRKKSIRIVQRNSIYLRRRWRRADHVNNPGKD